jgi:proline iminopeptidase
MPDLTPFSASGLAGWVRSGGEQRVLLLHGGPTLSHEYFRSLVDTLPGWSCASYQQRGRAPSTTQGPFDVPTFVADVGRVLDHLATLGWERPLVAGHSWGGHLAWHVAVTLPAAVGGVLAIDPMGAVGDMGLPAFGEELMRRLTPEAKARYDELEERWDSPGLTEAEALEQQGAIRPAYFADPANMDRLFAALEPVGPVAWQIEALMGSAHSLQPILEAALRAVRVPLGAVHGAASPMPVTASSDATDLAPGGWTEVVEDAGHFVWLERPDAVRTALERLLAQAPR